MRIFLLSFFCFSTIAVQGQQHDNVWLLGYAGGNQSPMNDYFGLSILNFNHLNQLTIINNQTSGLNFHSANSSMSDSSGHLLFYCNAERVYNANHNLMMNGSNLNITDKYGSALPQAALSLPFPGHLDQYVLFIMEDSFFSSEVLYSGYKVYYNLIDISLNNGSGAITEKKNRTPQGYF